MNITHLRVQMHQYVYRHRHLLLLILAIAVPAICSRIFLHYHLGIEVQVIDILGGMLSSIGIGCIAALFMLFAKRNWLKALLGFLFVTLMLILNHANYEHIKVHGSSIKLYFIGLLTDSTFLHGSALKTTSPLLLGLSCITAFALLLIGLSGWKKAAPIHKSESYKLLAFLILFSFGVNHIQQRDNYLSWRCYDPLYETILTLRKTLQIMYRSEKLVEIPPFLEKYEKDLNKDDYQKVNAVFNNDLSGKPIIEFPKEKQNVLLVLIESAAARYLPKAAGKIKDAHTHMVQWDEIGQNNILFNNYINPARMTIRGEFALLCGQYPNFFQKDIETDHYLQNPNPEHKCLPQRMKENGYQTMYMQAANLSFMHKDSFMPAAGFETSIGRLWYKYSYASGSWGVDDKAFFEQSLIKLRELNAKNQPWFSTLLTVGTHHPVILPDAWKEAHNPDGKKSDVTLSFEYADEAIGEFVAKLNQEGFLKNTLVLITSDEVIPSFEASRDFKNVYTQFWGPLTVLTPKKDKLVINEPFVQPDIATSILDYVGIADPKEKYFIGRSIFRNYDKPRAFPIGSFLTHVSGFIFPERTILLCKMEDGVCKTFDGERDDSPFFFATSFKGVRDANPKELGFFSAFLRRNERTLDPEYTGRHVQLTKLSSFVLNPGMEQEYLIRHSSNKIAAHEEVDVFIEIKVDSGKAEFYGGLESYSTSHHAERLTEFDHKIGQAGDTVRLKFSYNLASDRDAVIPYLSAIYMGEPTKISIVRAEMTISPSVNKVKGLTSENWEVKTEEKLL